MDPGSRKDRGMTLRSSLYRAARLLGDVQAAQRGPASLARRMVRKRVYRAWNRPLRRWLP